MVDTAFPTATTDLANVTRSVRLLADNGSQNGDVSISDVLKLFELGDLPVGQVAGDLIRWTGTSWVVSRAIVTGNLDPAASLADATVLAVFQGAASGAEVKTTLGDLYSYMLSRLFKQPTVIEDVPANIQAYTFQATDHNKVKRFLSATAVTVSVPAALPVGTNIGWIQKGAGKLTFQSATSAAQVIESAAGLRSAAQAARGSILQEAANVWNLSGLTVV